MGLFDFLFKRKSKKKKVIYSEQESNSGTRSQYTAYSDGSFIYESCLGEPLDSYFRYGAIITRNKNIYTKLDAVEKVLQILPESLAELRKDGDLPPLIPCRNYGPWLYEKLGQWVNARRVIMLCDEAGAYLPEHGEAEMESLESYKKTATVAINFLLKNPGYLQKDIYKALDNQGIDREQLKSFTRSSLLLTKEKFKKTNRLFINKEILKKSDIKLDLKE